MLVASRAEAVSISEVASGTGLTWWQARYHVHRAVERGFLEAVQPDGYAGVGRPAGGVVFRKARGRRIR